MERGVIAGGVLITASFLLAVLFNHSALKESASVPVSGPMTGSGMETHSAEPAADPVVSSLPGQVGAAGASSTEDCCKPGDESCLERKTGEAQERPICGSP